MSKRTDTAPESASRKNKGAGGLVALRDTAQIAPLLSCVGFGLLLAWKHINVSPSLFESQTIHVIGSLQRGGLTTIPLFVIAPILLGLLSWKRKEPPEATISLCSSLPLTIALAVLYADPSLSELARCAVGNICATLSSVLMLLWIKFLCDNLPGKALRYSSISFFVCFAVTLCSTFAPAPIATALHVGLPALSGICLVGIRPLYHSANAADCGNNTGRTPHPGKFPSRLFFGLAIITICIDLTNVFSEVKVAHPNELSLLVVGTVVTLVLLIATTMRDWTNLALSFKWIMVILVASMFFVLIFEFEQRIYETATLALGATLFRVLFYAVIFEVVRQSSRNSHMVILGIGQGILIATQYLNPFITKGIALIGLSPVVVIAVMTLLVIVATIFVINEQYVTSLIVREAPKVTYLDINDDAACRRCVTMAARQFGLTNREEQIALLLLKRLDNVDIHNELFIASSTLQVHLRNIYKKCDVHSRAELISTLESFAS